MFTPGEIDTIVGRALDCDSFQVLEHSLNSHSKNRVGFLGDHQNLEVTVSRGKSSKPETMRFFVKAEPMADLVAANKFIRERNLFSQEAAFFNRLLPELREGIVGDDFCPRCLLANDRFIVLEDMRHRGYAMRETKIFQGEYLKSALRAQARLHAASILAEERFGQPLNCVFSDACNEHVFQPSMYQRMPMYIDLAEQIAKRNGLDYSRFRAGLYRGFSRLAQPEGKGKLPLVVCHGDAWPNNSLFKESSSPLKCVLVDFQLTRYAPRMFDVAQMVYLSTTREIRKREERGVIEAYHKELCESLRRNNEGLERPSLEDLIEEYEDVRMTALLTALIYYPIICMSKKLLTRYEDNEDELYKKIMFRQSNDFVLEVCHMDDMYDGRHAEIVMELSEYCEKLDIPTDEENDI